MSPKDVKLWQNDGDENICKIALKILITFFPSFLGYQMTMPSNWNIYTSSLTFRVIYLNSYCISEYVFRWIITNTQHETCILASLLHYLADHYNLFAPLALNVLHSLHTITFYKLQVKSVALSYFILSSILWNGGGT